MPREPKISPEAMDEAHRVRLATLDFYISFVGSAGGTEKMKAGLQEIDKMSLTDITKNPQRVKHLVADTLRQIQAVEDRLRSK